MKYLIIGGVAGGATAAARLRRIDEAGEIILLEKGKYISYANCGLPYYIGGVIQERDRLLVQTPEGFARRFRVDVRTENEALRIDSERHIVEIRNEEGKTYEESYDRLLLSPGSTPVRPPLPGINTEGIFTLRTVDDTDRIKAYIEQRGVKRATVVGAGFIGLEMAENLCHAGIRVALVEMAPQVMAPLDFSMAAPVARHLVEKGVELHLEEAVASFGRTDAGIEVHLKSGKSIPSDLVLLSIGVRPNTALARQAGIDLGETGGIRVDEYLQTSARDIYAVGDAIEYPHPLSGRPWLNYLAGPANRQGRIAADNMARGNCRKYEGAIGTSVAKIFDLTVAATGLPAKRLRQWGIEYASSWTHPSSHASYYPGAMPLTLKLTFHPCTGQLYGAQAVGVDGVDKRIDQLAQLIKHGGTVYDLMQTEQAYAPPYSSAKDPVALAGYVAGNIIEGDMPVITWRQLQEEKDRVELIDVRTPEEYAFGTIPGAKNIPVDELRLRLDEVTPQRDIVVFCAVGLRGYLAQRILHGHGFERVRNLSGGYRTWSAATTPLPTTSLSAAHDDAPAPESTTGTFSASAPASNAAATSPAITLRIDACGLQCPGPILEVKKAIGRIQEGQCVEITSTDAGFARDAEAWCASTGHTLLERHEERGRYRVCIRKGNEKSKVVAPASAHAAQSKTLILFSDDFDKALATFVLANGAAATGKKVSIFFTFWGLNLLKKERKPAVKKDFFGRMFGWMLPSDSRHLKLSKLHMLGLGTAMMRTRMKQKGVASLETLRDEALAQGVEFIACQMSMDMMGIAREELLDGVTIGGVATYMQRAEEANVNLFI